VVAQQPGAQRGQAQTAGGHLGHTARRGAALQRLRVDTCSVFFYL
jgi:hypothetical protein